MVAILANVLMLIPSIVALGTVLLLAPAWLGHLILFALVITAFVVIPAYAVIGSVHAFCTASRDLRRQMAAAEAFHRAILAQHAALGGTPAPPRRCRLGEAE